MSVAPPPTRKNPRILVIEDSPVDGMLLKRLTESNGIGVVEIVPDGLAGFNRCLVNPPDVLVLDLELPNLRGEEILRMLRSTPRFRTLPILIISEMPDARRRELELLRIGADDYLEKPFDPKRYVEALRKQLQPREPGTVMLDAQTAMAVEDPPSTHKEVPASSDFISRSMNAVLGEEDTVGPPAPPHPGKKKQQPSEDASDTSTKEGTRKGPKPSDLDVFSGYHLIEIIGSGGMGTVYKARQVSLNRLVALKILLKARAEANQVIDRFREEARIMASLSHRNILQVIDAGDTPLTLYIAMEFISTGTLQDRMMRSQIPIQEFLSIANQTCNALIYLHDRGIVHRDIKPGNIFLTADGSVKVGDFGISRAQQAPSVSPVTTAYQILGTPSFMAPEVGVGIAATAASDQYSLGKTFLRLLLPASKVLTPEHLRDTRPDIPKGIVEILRRMTSSDTKMRFGSMGEVKTAFARLG